MLIGSIAQWRVANRLQRIASTAYHQSWQERDPNSLIFEIAVTQLKPLVSYQSNRQFPASYLPQLVTRAPRGAPQNSGFSEHIGAKRQPDRDSGRFT
jgi:hypothetical protein